MEGKRGGGGRGLKGWGGERVGVGVSGGGGGGRGVNIAAVEGGDVEKC